MLALNTLKNFDVENLDGLVISPGRAGTMPSMGRGGGGLSH